MQLCPTLGPSLSVAGSRRRKNSRGLRGRKRRRGLTTTRTAVLSRQNRRLWAGTFSRTLMFERMTYDGRTACRVLSYERAQTAPASTRRTTGTSPATGVTAGRPQVKPLPG